MELDEIKQMIESGIPVEYIDVNGDGTHFQAIVVSPDFSGLSTVQQHQAVYATLGNKIGNELHALSLKTFTPDEWKNQKAIKIIS